MGSQNTDVEQVTKEGNGGRGKRREKERKKKKTTQTMEARRDIVPSGDPLMLLGVIAGLTALTSVVQRSTKLTKFANDVAEFSSSFEDHEHSRSLSWPGRLVTPGEESNAEGNHLFLSDRAIFARLVQVIEDSGEVDGNEKQRSERRVAEKELGAGVEEEILVEKESLVGKRGVEKEDLVDRTVESPVGSVTCWARYAVCLTRSVFMSLRDLPNEGRVLVGLAFAALELVTTGGITEAYSDLNKVPHVRNTADCVQNFDK